MTDTTITKERKRRTTSTTSSRKKRQIQPPNLQPKPEKLRQPNPKVVNLLEPK